MKNINFGVIKTIAIITLIAMILQAVTCSYVIDELINQKNTIIAVYPFAVVFFVSWGYSIFSGYLIWCNRFEIAEYILSTKPKTPIDGYHHSLEELQNAGTEQKNKIHSGHLNGK